MEAPHVVDGNAFADLPKLVGEYHRRQPQDSVLYQVIEENYQPFLSLCEEEERPMPAFVRKEFERYLACGLLSEGFARIHCGGCGYDRLVGFSCKRRGWCPSCLGRRMNDGAAFLADQVIGDTPIRQWVLSLPPPLRYLLAYDSSLLSAVLGAFISAIFQFLRRKAKSVLGLKSVTMAHPGAVTSIQRSSSHLALNVHFHSLVTDGVFVQKDPADPITFHALPTPTDEEVTQVAWDTCRRTRDLLIRRGLWKDDPDPGDSDPLANAEPGLAATYQASIRGVLSVGPRRGQQVVRFFGEAAREDDPAVRQAGYGFNLHARRATFAKDRIGLERMARYILRPPVAQDSLELTSDGKVFLHLKRTWSDGTTGVVFEAIDFISKLAALIPRPRMNVIRFHGIYAPHARLRELVVPEPEELPEKAGCGCGLDDLAGRQTRLKWAELLARVFHVDVFRCSRCHSMMQRIAWIIDPATISKILGAVGQSGESPTGPPHRSNTAPSADGPAN